MHFFHFVFNKGFHVLWVSERELLLTSVRYLRSRDLTNLAGVILEHISVYKLSYIYMRCRVVDLVFKLDMLFPVVFLHEQQVLLEVLESLIGWCVDDTLL